MTFGILFDSVRPAYEIPEDDLVGEILTPALCAADEVRVAAGFFSSRCLAQIAGGLAAFINESDSSLDLMISPEISSEDREAIRQGLQEPEIVLENALLNLFEEARLSSSAIERHTVDTLAYLVASDRLKLRVVLMGKGMYHKKIWLLRAGKEWLAVHGSGNATERGLLVNGEQMSIDRAWEDGSQAQARVDIFLEQWDRQWNNCNQNSLTIEVSQALRILHSYISLAPPTVYDFWEAWRQDHEAGLEPELPHHMRHAPGDHRLRIPCQLDWREGCYSHQGSAVESLLANNGGIIAIATGGGKTITSLIAVTEMQTTTQGHLCIVILVPSRPLVRQWTEDIRAFGIEPVILTGSDSQNRRAEFDRITCAFMTSPPRTEVLIMTNNLFKKPDSLERRWLENLPSDVESILIADEVHNLGTPAFLKNKPDFFTRRIGLSATPIRQYDPDGTDKLFGFFGGCPVFEFSLSDAIEAGCLVPYYYYLHLVKFDSTEMEHYDFLTDELSRAGFRIDDDGVTVALTPKIERLLRERRGLVEQADAKLPALEAELRRMGTETVTKTLIYTSAKPDVLDKAKQITAVNGLLERLRIISHQYTYRETSTIEAQTILNRFSTGEYQALTAMKVLDEGIDIPQVDTAFLMASSTVQREWVQRRGRILRQAPSKPFAHLHDFIVLPPDSRTSGGQSLLKTELRRAREFASVAENEFDSDGPNKTIRQLETMIWSGARD